MVAGTNYFLTVIIGESDCEVGNIENSVSEFDKEECTINLEHDNNYMCEVVVYKPLKALGDDLILSQKNCRKGELWLLTFTFFFIFISSCCVRPCKAKL